MRSLNAERNRQRSAAGRGQILDPEVELFTVPSTTSSARFNGWFVRPGHHGRQNPGPPRCLDEMCCHRQRKVRTEMNADLEGDERGNAGERKVL